MKGRILIALFLGVAMLGGCSNPLAQNDESLRAAAQQDELLRGQAAIIEEQAGLIEHQAALIAQLDAQLDSLQQESLPQTQDDDQQPLSEEEAMMAFLRERWAQFEAHLKADLLSRPEIIPFQPPLPTMAQFSFTDAFFGGRYVFALGDDGHVMFYMLLTYTASEDGAEIDWQVVATAIGYQGWVFMP